MDYCLLCHETVQYSVSWRNLLLPKQVEENAALCDTCQNKFFFINDKICQKCGRLTDEEICQDCIRWQENKLDDFLVKNVSTFVYNEFIKEVMALWKYRGDYIVGNVFKNTFKKYFLKAFNQLENNVMIVPIPLSKERQYERGFNQAEQLAKFISPAVDNILRRVDGEKQSKKNRQERILSKNPFILTEPITKQVILIDDIYTTGTTVRQAAQLLVENGCPSVFSYTLIRA